jgi:hypothetical protein
MSGGPTTLHGARVIVGVMQADGKTSEIGVFNSCNYSVGITVTPVEVLGSFLPVELVQTSRDAIQVTCSGFRILNQGAYSQNKVPTVADLLRYDGITLTIYDRQKQTKPGAPIRDKIFSVIGAKCTGYRTTYSAKGIADLEITYMGIVETDETDVDGTGSAQKDNGAVIYPIAAQ